MANSKDVITQIRKATRWMFCADEKIRIVLEGLRGRRLKLGDTHPRTSEPRHNLIALYQAWNKPEQAEKWRAELPEMKAARE